MAQDINQLLQQINDLRQEYTNLTARPAALFNVTNITEAQAAIDALTAQIERAEKQAADLEAGFGGIASTVTKIVAELKKGNEPINLATSAFRKLQNSLEKLKLDQQGLNKLSKKQLEEEQKKQKIYQQTIRDQAVEIMRENSLMTLSGGMLENSLRRRIEAGLMSEAEAAIVRAAKEGFTIFEETNKLLQETVEAREKEEKSLRRSLGISGALLGAIGKIPVLGESAAKAYEKIKTEAEETYEATGKHPGAFKNFGKAISETGKILLEKIKDPMVIVGGLVSMLIKGFLDSDKATTQLQKNLTISKEEALALNKELSAATLNLDDMFISSRDMTKIFGTLQSSLGSVGDVTTQTAETFARLNKLVGLTEEEAGGLAAQVDAFGKNSDDVYKAQLRTTHQVSQQYKTQVNQKAVLAEVGKASAYTLVQFRGSTQALTEAVAKSKALGINMETLGKISSGLLDFQSSIENELSAELLTGKQLNLEQARYYALTNQQSKLMDELNSQIGTFSDFSNMNVVQQEAYAKALGMSSNELSEMLFKQEYRGKTEKEIANIADEDLRKRVEALSLQDKFQAAMDKLSATMADFVAGPLGSFLTSTTGIYTILGVMAVSALPKLIQGFGLLAKAAKAFKLQEIGSAIASGWTAAMSSPQSLLTGGLIGLATGAAITAAILAATSTGDDLFSAGGYGKRTLLAPEGAFRLNDNDNIVATTNPINANDIISGPKGSTKVSTGQQSVQSINNQVSIAPSNTRITLSLDGKAIGNANAIQDYGITKSIKAFGSGVEYSA